MELSLSQCDGKRSGDCVGCICIKVIVPEEIGICVCIWGTKTGFPQTDSTHLFRWRKLFSEINKSYSFLLLKRKPECGKLCTFYISFWFMFLSRLKCSVKFNCKLQDLFKKVITVRVILLYSHVENQGIGWENSLHNRTTPACIIPRTNKYTDQMQRSQLAGSN